MGFTANVRPAKRRCALKRMRQNYVFIALAVLAGCALKTADAGIGPPAYFSSMSAHDRKHGFIHFLRPIIRAENERIKARRARLLALSPVRATAADRLWLNELASNYGLKTGTSAESLRNALIRRVDIVPEWLALMQAANESGWGTSRFAREGNNLFGQWCFTKGCGIVPERRIRGASHEVAVFKSPAESVRAYMHNLNTGKMYHLLREIRAELRKQGKPLAAEVLATGLEYYSGRGLAYVEDMRRMIRENRGV